MSFSINGAKQVSNQYGDEKKVQSQKSEPKTEKSSYSNDRVEITMREERPFTVSGGVGYPNGIHVGVDYNLSKKLSLGTSVGSTVMMNEYEIHGRFYPIGGKTVSLYTETGAGLLQTNKGVFNPDPKFQYGVALSQSVGLEYRAENGLTVNASVGKAMAVTGKLAFPTVGKISVGFSF